MFGTELNVEVTRDNRVHTRVGDSRSMVTKAVSAESLGREAGLEGE